MSLSSSAAKPVRQSTQQDQRKSESLANRVERYQQIKLLQEQGLSNRQITLQLGLNRNSVNRYVQAEDAQEAVGFLLRREHRALSDVHKVYLYQRFSHEQTCDGYFYHPNCFRLYLRDG